MLKFVELLKLYLAAKKTDIDCYARTMLTMKTKQIKKTYQEKKHIISTDIY